MVTTDALKNTKKAGMAKILSHSAPHVKRAMMRMSREVVTPDATSSVERLLGSNSWPAAMPLNAGIGSIGGLESLLPLAARTIYWVSRIHFVYTAPAAAAVVSVKEASEK